MSNQRRYKLESSLGCTTHHLSALQRKIKEKQKECDYPLPCWRAQRSGFSSLIHFLRWKWHIHFPTLVTPCIALSSYSLSPQQGGMQTARLGPQLEDSVPMVRGEFSKLQEKNKREQGTLKSPYQAPCWQGAGACCCPYGCPSTAGTELFSLLLPPALAHFRNLAKSFRQRHL